MTLADVKQGQKIVIRHIADPLVRVQAIRFGTCREVQKSRVSSVIASGPITVKKKHAGNSSGARPGQKDPR